MLTEFVSLGFIDYLTLPVHERSRMPNMSLLRRCLTMAMVMEMKMMSKPLLTMMLCGRTFKGCHVTLEIEMSRPKLMCQHKQRQIPSLKSCHPDSSCCLLCFKRRHYVALTAKSRVEEATPDYATWSPLSFFGVSRASMWATDAYEGLGRTVFL